MRVSRSVYIHRFTSPEALFLISLLYLLLGIGIRDTKLCASQEVERAQSNDRGEGVPDHASGLRVVVPFWSCLELYPWDILHQLVSVLPSRMLASHIFSSAAEYLISSLHLYPPRSMETH